MNEVLDYLVNLALEEADVRIEDYIDVDYFANLKASTEISVNEIQKLSNVESSDEEIYDEISFDEEQYYALTESITGIFSELTTEEYEVFETLAEDDEDIREMLTMVENGFEEYDESSQVSYEVATSNVVKLSAAVMTIGSILSGQQVCQAAIIAIKGAFNSMVATLKAFFVPTSVKAVIVTAAILVLTTVVIVNWNKIKPVFNQIVNVFVDNAKKLATTVRNVFNTIYQSAKKSEDKDVSDNASSPNQMQKQVEKGQAPDEVDRVDKAHDKYGQDHVHFKDGTSINKDGTIHDKGKGTPKLTRKVLDWLNKNGWCLNGLKN